MDRMKLSVRRKITTPLLWSALVGGAIVASYAVDNTSLADEKMAGPHSGMAKPVIMTTSEMKWTPSPALPSTMAVTLLYGDLSKAGPVGFRIKVPKGGRLAPHTHPVEERVTVVSGRFAMGEGTVFDEAALRDMPLGSVAIFPTGCPMFGHAHEDTVIQVNAEGPWGITYSNPKDDPRLQK